MKRILFLFLLFLTFAQIHSEGFVADTLVDTPDGYKQIEDIKSGNNVFSYVFTKYEIATNTIKEINSEKTKKLIKIELENDTEIFAAPDQIFFLYKNFKMAPAKKLKAGKLLASINGPIKIKCVETLKTNADAYTLSVGTPHNFFVTEQNILVHNFAIAAALSPAVYQGIAIAIAGAMPKLKQLFLSGTVASFFIDKVAEKHRKQIPLNQKEKELLEKSYLTIEAVKRWDDIVHFYLRPINPLIQLMNDSEYEVFAQLLSDKLNERAETEVFPEVEKKKQ